MPSIPQSLLWISLVVLWLFVLVPMLISKRDAVRRTSDVALATRVLNSGKSALRRKRGGPAAGHNSDPDWRPSETGLDDDMVDDAAPAGSASARAVVLAPKTVAAEADYLDVEVVEEDSGALPVGNESADAPEEFEGDPEEHQECDPTADGYEYVEDSSGLEAPADDEELPVESPGSERRRQYAAKAALASARKYKFRIRTLVALALIMVGSAVTAFFVSPLAWWACGSLTAFTVMYLAYLRRQTRIEEQFRRRRMQRLARSRLGVENTRDTELDVVPSRLRQPGAAVLEIDDEDPIFEHLEYRPAARRYDMPWASGQ
jgi:hypothetical protein